jgi:hypothetical protein
MLTDEEHQKLRELREERQGLGERKKIIRYQGCVTKNGKEHTTYFYEKKEEACKRAKKLGKEHFDKYFRIKIRKIKI